MSPAPVRPLLLKVQGELSLSLSLIADNEQALQPLNVKPYLEQVVQDFLCTRTDWVLVDELNSQDVIDICLVAARKVTTIRRTTVLSDPSTTTTPSILYYLPNVPMVQYGVVGETKNQFFKWELNYDVLQLTNSIYKATHPNSNATSNTYALEDALTIISAETQQAWNAALQTGWVDDQLLKRESSVDPFYRASIVGREAELFSRGTVNLTKTIYDPMGADWLRYIGVFLCVFAIVTHEGLKRLGKRRRLRREKDQELRIQDKGGLATDEGLDLLLESTRPEASENDDNDDEDDDDDRSRASLRSSASRVSRVSLAASAISISSIKSTKNHKSTRSSKSTTSTKSDKSTMSTKSNKSTTSSKSKPKHHGPSLALRDPRLHQLASGHDHDESSLGSDEGDRSVIPMPMAYVIHSPTTKSESKSPEH